MKIEKVGVLGMGLMGSGIAQVCATAGYPTVAVEVEQTLVDRGMASITKNLGRMVEKATITAANRDEALARITTSTDVSAFAGCDLVIEAIIENLEVKRSVYAKLDGIVKREAVFASNT